MVSMILKMMMTMEMDSMTTKKSHDGNDMTNIYDHDNDGISDKFDMDIDNDGIDNYKDIHD